MNYEKIRQNIQAIVEISNNVPDPFKEKCFELLLTSLITESELIDKEQSDVINNKDKKDSNGARLPTPAVVKVFMQRNKITEEELSAVLFHENGEIYFVKEPNTKTISQGQIEWALLLALKKAFVANEFTVDPEDVRSICQEKGYYSQTNFAANFKNNAKLFKNPMKSQGEPQLLTPEGQASLAALIKTLASRP